MKKSKEIIKVLLEINSNLLKLDENYDKDIERKILELIKLLISDTKISDIKYKFRILTDILIIANETLAKEILELEEIQYLLNNYYNDRKTFAKEILELKEKF
jgi:hypothetical protein